MKTKLAAMAGGLACVFATAVMPIHAEETYTAVSGSSVSLSVDEGAIVHTVAIPLKKNGKKFNKDGTTTITKQKTDPFPIGACGDGTRPLFGYEYADSVLTRPNGDLIVTVLDPAKVSTICALLTHFEVTLYTKIVGGTGEFEGACGWQTTTMKGKYLLGHIFPVEGTTVGEIFRDCN